MSRETFALQGKGKDNCIHLTDEQAALIHTEFTPDGKKFYSDLYDGLYKDTFGKSFKPNKLMKGMTAE